MPTLVKTVSSVAGGSASAIPVSTGVNISVTLSQQQKALSEYLPFTQSRFCTNANASAIFLPYDYGYCILSFSIFIIAGAISKAGLTGSQPHQFRQIQLLHNKQVARPQLQKLSKFNILDCIVGIV